MADYVDKITYELNNKMIIQDVEKLSKVVDKIVDKLADSNDKFSDVYIKLEKHDKDIEYHNESQNRLEKSIDKLIKTFEKFSLDLNRVDRETALNTQSIGWSFDFNWKTISAIFTGIGILIAAWKQ